MIKIDVFEISRLIGTALGTLGGALITLFIIILIRKIGKHIDNFYIVCKDFLTSAENKLFVKDGEIK